MGGDEENVGKDDAEKTKAACSFFSFSLVKETTEPWYPPLLSVKFSLGLNLNRSNFFRPPEMPQKRDQHIIGFEWY